MMSVCDPHVSTELGELTMLSPFSIFERLRLVHLTGDSDKGLAEIMTGFFPSVLTGLNKGHCLCL